MNRKERADIPHRLRRLRKVSAPTNFEILLHRRIRALPPRARLFGWLQRPVSAALFVAGGALVVAAFFMFPHDLPGPSPVSGKNSIAIPAEGRDGELLGLDVPPKPQMTVDSLSADSASLRKTDVNTSNLP